MRSRLSLTLGLEKIGLLAMRAPILSLCLIAVLAAVAVWGTTRLRADDALDDLLRSSSEEYLTFERFRAQFPTSELDLVFVTQLPAPVGADTLTRLQDLHLELGLTDGVANMFSMFSVHRPDPATGQLQPLIPDSLPSGADHERLVDLLASDPLVSGRFFRRLDDGSALALSILELDPAVVQDRGLTRLVLSVKQQLHRLAKEVGLSVEATGAPAMKTEILLSAQADSRFFNIAGFAIGFVICWLFFRNPRLVLLVLLPTMLAVLCSLGLFGLVGVTLNPLMNTIIPLVMVMSFANAMHLVFAIRNAQQQGSARRDAVAEAVQTVGPACVLSALTTAIAFCSLAFTDSRLVSEFGFAAAATTGLSLLLVVAAVPSLALYLMPDGSAGHDEPRTTALSVLERGFDSACLWLARRFIRPAWPIAVAGLIAIIASGFMYLRLEPSYRLTDVLRDNAESATAARYVDRQFGGLNTLHVMISWQGRLDAQAREILQALDEVHHLLETEPLLANTRSVVEIRRLQSEPSRFDVDWIEALPGGLAQRYFSKDRQASVVSANTRDFEASELERLRDDLETRLDGVRAGHPTLTFELTGLAALSANRAIHTIESLNRGLAAAMLLVLILLGLLLRSLDLALISFGVNLFAVLATGALIYLTWSGLQYVSVVGLTVAFGIAVDDTVHFLNRFRLALDAGRPWAAAVRHTVERTGPILMLTTLVIVCGMTTTLASQVPPTRTFGILCIATLLFALIGDLVILPASLLAYRRARLAFGRRTSLRGRS